MARGWFLAGDVDRREVHMTGIKINIVLLWWAVICIAAKFFTLSDIGLVLGPVIIGVIVWWWTRRDG
jgi:hypothetical protein